jgi:hypothetical protein
VTTGLRFRLHLSQLDTRILLLLGDRLERVVAVLLDELDEVVKRSVTLVVDEFLGAGRLELDSGEA